MHLSGEADAGNVFACEICCRKRFVNGSAGGAPPVFGMLFRPANLRRCEGLMIRRGGRNEPPALFDDDRARAACANVNPKYVDKALLDSFEPTEWRHHIQSSEDDKGGSSVNARPCEELQQDLESNGEISILGWSQG